MKLRRSECYGFTLTEMLLGVSIGSLMLAAIVAASVCLQRSFVAVDGYFASQMQQVRIVDYLNRDVKRSYIVTTSTDLQTLTCVLPNYLIDNGSNQPTRASPTLSLVGNKIVANYQATTVSNVTTTQNSTTISCPGLNLVSSHFTSAHVGQSVIGTGIPVGATKTSHTINNNTTINSQVTSRLPMRTSFSNGNFLLASIST